jgi:hypothetical protein
MDIAAWPGSLGLRGTSRRSGQNEIDAEVLPELTETDLAAQWLELLDLIIDRVSALPVLLIIAYRPEVSAP